MDHDKDDELFEYASEGLYSFVKFLVSQGVDLDIKDSYGRTPLLVAAGSSHREVVLLLIDSGADIHCCDNEYGWTVLHCAAFEGWVEIAQCLVQKGVALDMTDYCGRTPLMVAFEWSHGEIVDLLINSGADIHCCVDDNGWTLLHHSAYKGWVEISQCLLNNGIAIDVKGHNGNTPLMVAAQESRREIVKLLINSGADIHCCDNNGRTALHYVYSNGEIADFLLKAGADCNLEDHEGKSAFNYLISEEIPYVEIIKLFIQKGAYVKSTDYNSLVEHPFLKEAILQDIQICTQAIINKFNYQDLPLLYKRIPSAYKLPHIDKMRIGSRSGMVLEVENAVAHEIKTKGFCNLFETVPLVLGILCVKSAIEKLIPAFNWANLLQLQIVRKDLDIVPN